MLAKHGPASSADVMYAALPVTPLEEDSESGPVKIYSSEGVQEVASPELPKLQMLAYAGIRSSEPFMFFVLLPFINAMLVEYGICSDERSTGYIAGLLEAAVWIANIATMMPWIYIADRFGRRLVLLWSTLICTVMGMLIGLPKSLSSLLILRFLAGFWNGQAAVSKTYLSELANEANEAKAFAIQSLGWQIGWSLAGMAGGYLSHHEHTFPSLANNKFIKTHPYALGPLVASTAPLISVFAGFFILRETLPPGGFRANLHLNSDMWSALKVWIAMVSCNISFMCTMPLFMFAPVAAGGLALPMTAMGRYYAVRSAIIILVEFPSKLVPIWRSVAQSFMLVSSVYPRLHRRFGSSGMLKAQIALYPVIFALFPIVSMCRRWSGIEHIDGLSLAMLGLLTILEALAQTIFISGDLLCTNAAPNRSLQSKYNALVELIAKVGQLVFTWSASWLFALSAESQLFWGYLVWIVLFINAMFGVRICLAHQKAAGWRSTAVNSPMTPMTPY